MRKFILLPLLLVLTPVLPLLAVELESLPSDPYFAAYKPFKAPQPEGLLLKPGDRLAICGDSITEQKMYSRIIETYLTVSVPRLNVTVRQHGWGGEKSPGLLARMENDVLRFKPTIVTTCYGMNDHNYQTYQEEFGRIYRDASRAIIQKFKETGVRVIQGAAGNVGIKPPWAAKADDTVDNLNLSLLEFRNIDVTLAHEENVAFADCFLPMLVAGFEAKKKYGDSYMLSGKDGVHPGWAGHLVMAYAFLKAMGLDGNIGTITLDLASGEATASEGHQILESDSNEVEVKSSRYPFCATGPIDKDSSIRSGMTLVPFNEELNRFILLVKNTSANRYRITWGKNSKTYTAEELTKGINLAADFELNPFTHAFLMVDEIVGRKQAFETKQMKEMMHGKAGSEDMEGTVAKTESERDKLTAFIKAAIVPVTHTIRIVAE
ncbi:MAG: hypothetical protein A2167_07340 [Planctomycetes bacterium RBG_13_46_10]|nr:MAG: hypothetical protein A2167_07340 [Planctomycetes bacterium RBG_13_46_10]